MKPLIQMFLRVKGSNGVLHRSWGFCCGPLPRLGANRLELWPTMAEAESAVYQLQALLGVEQELLQAMQIHPANVIDIQILSLSGLNHQNSPAGLFFLNPCWVSTNAGKCVAQTPNTTR